MQWKCYAWTGHAIPTDEQRADPTAPVPGIHPRDWLNKPIRPDQIGDSGRAVAWFRNLMARARVDPSVTKVDVTADNIVHGCDVSAWARLGDGTWLSWAVLRVDEPGNGAATGILG